jgi:HAD superfamily hydrolase (TIGR01509 family)
MPKAVIYDLDDLMVNSYPLHAEAWKILLLRYGFTGNRIVESGHIGMRVKDVAAEIAKELKLSIDPEALYKQHEEIFLQLVHDGLDMMPGLVESLDLFKKNGYRIAIASSGSRRYIDAVLQRFRLADYFSVIVTGDDVTKGKPDPEVYRKAALRLGVPPEECLVLEDATKGIEAAKAAGCRCIAVRNPHTPKQETKKADLTVERLGDIMIEQVKALENKDNGE